VIPALDSRVRGARRLQAFAALEASRAAIAACPLIVGHAGKGRPPRPVRAAALYLAVTVFDSRQTEIARAAAVSKQAVQEACRAIEDRRDDRAFDQWLQHLEGILCAP
jgi:hypothetical protein